MKTVKYLNIAAALVLAALFFASCYTERKATSDVGKAATKYPAVVAAACVKYFPVKVTGSDTTHSIDSVDIYIPCPEPEADLSELAAEDYAGKAATGNQPSTTKHQPSTRNPKAQARDSAKVKVPIRYITITNYKKDSTNEVILQANAKALTKKLQTQYNWLVFAFSLAGSFLLLLLILLYFFNRLYKKLRQ